MTKISLLPLKFREENSNVNVMSKETKKGNSTLMPLFKKSKWKSSKTMLSEDYRCKGREEQNNKH